MSSKDIDIARDGQGGGGDHDGRGIGINGEEPKRTNCHEGRVQDQLAK